MGATNAALVAIDPASGHVLAMVGSPDYFDQEINGQVNNAVALHQPGSSIKPIIYLAAFLKGRTPSTVVEDGPLSVNDNGRVHALTNADNRFRGRLPVRQARVWVGNDDNSSLAGGTLSSRTAAPIWHEFMVEALWDQPPLLFDAPPGVSVVPVCAITGQLPVPGCPTVSEVFIAGQEPKRAIGLPRAQPSPTPPPETREAPQIVPAALGKHFSFSVREFS